MKQTKQQQKGQLQRQSISIQSNSSRQPNHNKTLNIKNANRPDAQNKLSVESTNSPKELVSHIYKAEVQYQEGQRMKKQAPQSRVRGHQINLMKLKDKHFNLTKNVYNISIGQLTNHQAYLTSLQQEIEGLKQKLQNAQEQQSFAQDGQQSEHQPKTTYSRKSMCGRIYKKGQSINQSINSERQSIKGLNQKKYSSSFYKWNPQMDQNLNGRQSSSQIGKIMETISTSRYGRQIKNPQQTHKRPISYRLKQKTTIKPIYKQKSKQIHTQKSWRLAQAKSSKEPEEPKEQIESKEVVEPQAQWVNVSQIQIKKQVFVKNQDWQIKGIQDDFRAKIIKKLQIPDSFLIEAPDNTGTLDQYKEEAVKLYSIFGIDIEKCKNQLVVRKFKNGIYYQLRPNKNILWYFNGSFYFGQWETDLPTESQKNGFGFQYIPNKYIYLGEYKNGMKNGKGTIKIIPKPTNSQDLFTAYDGSWLDGKPHGFGAQIDEKDNKYIGSFVHGQKTGKCLLLNKQGLFYEGEIEKGIKNGKGIQKLINGDQYIGYFREGKFHGFGTYKWCNGSVYQGYFVNGKRDGKGKWKSQNGDLFEGEYQDDMKHGFGKFTWVNGQIYQGDFRHDVRHGEGIYRHPSGKMGKFMWKQGQIDYRLYSREQQEYRTRNLREKQEKESLEQLQ